jgi:hypothetical protein
LSPIRIQRSNARSSPEKVPTFDPTPAYPTSHTRCMTATPSSPPAAASACIASASISQPCSPVSASAQYARTISSVVNGAAGVEERESSQTHRWREMDSNLRFLGSRNRKTDHGRRDCFLKNASGSVGEPEVRIRFPPPASLQTPGPS